MTATSTRKSISRNAEFSAFLSHASPDAQVATQVKQAAEQNGAKLRLDETNLVFGALLRDELQAAIRNCRVLVLL